MGDIVAFGLQGNVVTLCCQVRVVSRALSPELVDVLSHCYQVSHTWSPKPKIEICVRQCREEPFGKHKEGDYPGVRVCFYSCRRRQLLTVRSFC